MVVAGFPHGTTTSVLRGTKATKFALELYQRKGKIRVLRAAPTQLVELARVRTRGRGKVLEDLGQIPDDSRTELDPLFFSSRVT